MSASFPHWNQTVSTSTKSSTIFRAIITNYALMQSKYRDAMLPYESMEGFIKGFSATNKAVTGIVSHEDITRTASQHHRKLHATTHITASDMIPLATSTVAGLMSTTQFIKIGTLATGANYRPINVGKYTGNSTNLYQWVGLTYKPRYLKIFHVRASQIIFMYEIIDGNAKTIVHKVSTLAHSTLINDQRLLLTATGFRGGYGLNSAGNNYFYLAMG